MAITDSEIYYFDISKIGRDFTGTKDVSILYNEQSLLEAITNILATEPGERVMNPEFGCKLSKYVFEPIDYITAGDIQSEIIYAINKFESRVENLVVKVTPLEDLNTFEIEVIFNMKIKNPDETQIIILKLNKIR